MKLQPLYVTAQMLRGNGACSANVDLFLDTFGDKKVRLTRANFDKAYRAGISTWWLGYRYATKNGDSANARLALNGETYRDWNRELGITDPQSDHNLAWGAIQAVRTAAAKNRGMPA